MSFGILHSSWKRNAACFLASQLITLFGSALVQMAVIWYVTMNTSSGAWVAAFIICAYIPQFVISFIGGVWADRFSRKGLIILSDSLIAVVTFISFLVMLFFPKKETFLWLLLIMSAVRSLGAGVQMPAVSAAIVQLVPEEKLMRFNGINSAMQSFVQFAAPAAAGMVLTVSSLRPILLIDVLTAVVGIGLFACVIFPKQESKAERISMLDDMKLGVYYAFADKLLGKLLIVYGIFIFLCVPAGFMSGLLVSRVYGDKYWYLMAVELIGFFGMMGGGLLMSMWGGFKSRVKTLLTGIILFGMLSIGMGIANNFILYLVYMLFYGIALTMIQITVTTIIQEKSESAMQGRVFGLLGCMYSGFLPIGMAFFGPLADVIALQLIMIVSGIGLLLTALAVRLKLCLS